MDTQRFKRILKAGLIVAAMLLFVRPDAQAQQLKFEFRNPAFGGSYLNYSWLMSSAEAQKDYKEESSVSSYLRDPLEDFEQSVQRQILSNLSRELIYNRFRDLDLSKEGRYDLGDFVVQIVPGLTGIEILVQNVLTGDESTITIPNY